MLLLVELSAFVDVSELADLVLLIIVSKRCRSFGSRVVVCLTFRARVVLVKIVVRRMVLGHGLVPIYGVHLKLCLGLHVPRLLLLLELLRVVQVIEVVSVYF
jgi:hypothetical protein